ncbi:hypothetical protein GF373_14810 [bacterium]|nr:hypothetical protein [bacterium]
MFVFLHYRIASHAGLPPMRLLGVHTMVLPSRDIRASPTQYTPLRFTCCSCYFPEMSFE